mmetsp:Transcript_8000/g.16834  ORF Transcript_8000/g.16834 Transcript_8000/m.16834 type:complete len:148 (-) Transcript_8000:29-472(-)
MLTLTFLAFMVVSRNTCPSAPSHAQDTLPLGVDALSFGNPSFKLKQPSALSTASTSVSPQLQELSFAFSESPHCLQRVATEILQAIQQQPTRPLIQARLHEDNNSAYLLANNQQLSSRSRHLNVKYHFFWEHVNNGTLEVCKINTKE